MDPPRHFRYNISLVTHIQQHSYESTWFSLQFLHQYGVNEKLMSVFLIDE